MEILFSKEKIDLFNITYSYQEGNAQDNVCQICDKYDNSNPIKPKKSGNIFLNTKIYEKNNKMIKIFISINLNQKNVRIKNLTLKLIDIGHEIQIIEFY